MAESFRRQFLGDFGPAVAIDFDSSLIDGGRHLVPAADQLPALLKEKIGKNCAGCGQEKNQDAQNYVNNFHRGSPTDFLLTYTVY